MRKVTKNQNGFTIIEFVIVLLVIIVLIGIGIYGHVHRDNQNSAATSPYTGWKLYCDTNFIGCIKYPSNWVLSTQSISGTNHIANAQLDTPRASANPINILYNFEIQGPGSTNGDQIINKYNLAKPTNGYKVYEGIINGSTAPYIALVDSSGSLELSNGKTSFALAASPDNLPFSTATQANAWFNTPQAKTALLIIESFYFSDHK